MGIQSKQKMGVGLNLVSELITVGGQCQQCGQMEKDNLITD